MLAFQPLVALAIIPAGDEEEFSVAEEFELHPIVKLPKLGPIDLSITKAVVYLWLATAVLIVVGMRVWGAPRGAARAA